MGDLVALAIRGATIQSPHNTIRIAIRRSQYNTYCNTHFPEKINKFLNDKVNHDKFRKKNIYE